MTADGTCSSRLLNFTLFWSQKKKPPKPPPYTKQEEEGETNMIRKSQDKNRCHYNRKAI